MSDWEAFETPEGRARLKYSHRRTLAISVLPDGSLELIAPLRTPKVQILERIQKRSRWIEKQKQVFLKLNGVRQPLRYANGATHRYLGRQYRLKVAVGASAGVLLKGAYLHVTVPLRNDDLVKKALFGWYRCRAIEQFEKRLRSWDQWCKNRKLPAPRLRMRAMEKRWGSALQDGVICLTPDLIRASSACVDYVITHEICHLKHPDHGPKFRALLQQLCPEWRGLKERLEQMN